MKLRMMGVLACATFLTMALCGCSTSSTSSSVPASASSTPSGTSVGIANPWHDAADGVAAGEGAGLGEPLNAPNQLPVADLNGIENPRFSYMTGTAQATYSDETVKATLRKSKDASGKTLHGVYDEFKSTWGGTLGDITVTCKGDKGVANLVEWSANGFNYSLYVASTSDEPRGVREGEYIELVKSIS